MSVDGLQTAGESGIRFTGSGPGEQTRDGCSVEFYRHLPVASEPEIIASQVPPPAELLELGCGVGRLTHAFVDLGYEVTAVDNSAAMLAHVRNAATVLSDIESLKLDKRFDVVVLASRILNAPSSAIRHALLQTVTRHLKPGAVFLAEIHAASVLEQSTGDSGEGPDYFARILSAEVTGMHAAITIEYTIGSDVWTQSYESEYLTELQVNEMLEDNGLQFDGWADDAQTWVCARPR